MPSSWVAAGEILALYGLFFESDPNAYGALGALLAVLLWMNVVSQVLFGGELFKVVAAGSSGAACSRGGPAASAA